MMNRIAELREAADLTQSDLAEKLGCHWITISRLERGKMNLTVSWMERLAGGLGVSPSHLLTTPEDVCPYCGVNHGPLCPLVKAYEYHPDGSLKRVEFKTAADYQGATWVMPDYNVSSASGAA